MHSLLDDLHFAVRNLLKKPGTTALILVTLALGIGANSAMFSMVYHILLAPLPYADGEQFVRIEQHERNGGRADYPLSVQTLYDYRNQNTAFSDIFEYHAMQFTLLGHGDPIRVQTGVVNWNFFDVLGVQPVIGRSFLPGEDEIGAEPLILLSHEFWVRQFASDPDVVGANLEMNNAIHRVIGVLPPIPAYPDANDIWITWASCPFRSSEAIMNNRNVPMVRAYAKLKDGISHKHAHDDMNGVAQRLVTTYPDTYSQARGYGVELTPVREELVGDARGGLLLLMGIATLVVLIASANVANLNLARMASRSQELAIREAVGANPRRISRQLLTESIVLALVGGALGLIVAYPALGLLADFAASYTRLAGEIGMSWQVLLFSLVVALLTGTLSGSAAAFTQRDINKALKEGGDKVTTSRGGQRRRQALLVVQFALSFVILTCAALISLSLYRLGSEDTGFDAEQVTALSLDLNFTNYTNADQFREFGKRLLREVQALPEVQLASIAAEAPLAGGVLGGGTAFDIEGRTLPNPDMRPRMDVRQVSADYHTLLGIPLLKGRLLQNSDDELAEPVVVVNAAFEREHFGVESAIGQRISTDNGASWFTIVGVVANIRARELNAVEGATAYVDFRQAPISSLDLLVKSHADSRRLGSVLVDIVHAIDPQQAVDSVQTLAQIKAERLATPRLIATLVGLFGLLALWVTLSGVVGVVSYNVSQRIREVGVHMAIGANPRHIIRMFLVHGLRIHAAGIALGLTLMLALASLLGGFLYRTNPFDALVYAAILVLLTLTVAGAMYVPASRAGALEPVNALRNE
ncbi:MAG: ABC transporter permease [Gammaproteobacteria bacterium]